VRSKLASIMFIACLSSVFGQTPSDITKKYGEPMSAYSVSEHISMTPQYTIERQVCQMRLYPKRIAKDANYLYKHLPFEELNKVLNQLVPPPLRGLRNEPFSTTATGGGAAWTTYQYENVTFTFVSAFNATNSPPLKKGEYTFPVLTSPTDKKQENSEPSDSDFVNSKELRLDVVTIKWNHRRCVEQ
jgi:hypothetical protein